MVAPHLRVRACLGAWEHIGAGDTVLNWIKYGYRLPFVEQLKPFCHRPLKFSPQEVEALEEIKNKLLAIGAVELTDDTTFVSRSRLEPKKDGGFRLIVDLRHVNSHLVGQSCKYETLQDLQHIVQPQDWMISCDLENGYYHVGLHEQHRRFITTIINGTAVRFCALPFGLSTAPRVFTKFMRPVVAALRGRGLRMLQYLDDSLFMHPSRSALQRTAIDVDNLFTSLGLVRKLSKGCWTPTQQLKHLGIVIDTQRSLFLVPPEKQDTVRGAAASLLRYAASHRRWVSARRLANLCGTVISLAVAMPLARTVTRSMYDVVQTRSSWSGDVQLHHQAIRDLQFLVELPLEHCDKAIWLQQPMHSINTDASDSGWGALMDQLVPAQGFFNAAQQQQHITAKELLAVRNALQDTKQHLQQGQAIKIITDNMAVRAVINKGVSHSPRLMQIYRDILRLCLKQGIVLQAEYIPTHLNVDADFLSRINPAGEWSLPSAIIRRSEEWFGRRTIDLFASPESAVCRRYCSIIPHADSLGDAFAHNWSQERAWLCPPFALLSRVVEQLHRQGGEAVLIAPHWPAAPWYPALGNMADYKQIIPQQYVDHIITHSHHDAEVRRNSRWKLALYHVPFRKRPPDPLC